MQSLTQDEAEVHVTITEKQIQKISQYIRPTVQDSILERIREDLKNIFKEAVSEVIED